METDEKIRIAELKTNDFLKTWEGFQFIQRIAAEYGTWDEEKQMYNMPFSEAFELAKQEVFEFYLHNEGEEFTSI